MDAVLQVSVSANYKLYEEMREAQKDGMAQGEMKAKKETALWFRNGLPAA